MMEQESHVDKYDIGYLSDALSFSHNSYLQLCDAILKAGFMCIDI